jgi:hypothetical protein
MARRPTPRPEFDSPALLRPDTVVRHLWGDDESGRVGDEVLLSSQRLHALIFTLAPGGRFGHSPDNRTVFAADETYLVLEGTIAVVNPEVGEIVRAEVGDIVFLRRDTWHHGINWGTGPVRVLEFFSPPPATGASSAYAQTRPYLDRPMHSEDGVIGRWPMARAEVESRATLTHIRPADLRWRAEGDLQVGVACSTEHLTVTVADLLPGQSSDERTHDGDALVHVLAGELHAHTPGGDWPTWWRVTAGDSLVLPEGCAYRLVNQGGLVARAVIGSAPGYLREPGG